MPSIQSLTMTCDALNADGTCSEGDTLTGKVTLALLKETTVERLYVKAKGDALVRWTKKSGNHTHTYSAHNRYFKEKQFLTPEHIKDAVLPRGSHVYKFSLKIPPHSMPSSFKGSHGKIVYKLEAKLSRSWKRDHIVEQHLHFVSKSSRNIHSLMLPQTGSKKKEMGLFSKGHADMDVSVDRMAYAPGETIAIVARIKNFSSSEMIPKFRLIQEVVYHANGSVKHETHNILKVVDDSIQPQTQKDVTCSMKIPSGQVLTIENCDIISVKYNLKAYLDISFAFDPEILFPVVIMPQGFASGHQPGAAAGPYPAGAVGGPSNCDFPPPAVYSGPHPVSPRSGSYGNPGAQNYSAPPPVYPHNPSAYAHQPGVYPAQSAHRSGGYNNPGPQLAFPYGSPSSSLSLFSVLHPPPNATTFQASAPEIHPSPSPSPFNIAPTAPPYNLPPSAPTMNTDFLSQSDEAPPAYSLLFPSSATDKADAK